MSRDLLAERQQLVNDVVADVTAVMNPDKKPPAVRFDLPSTDASRGLCDTETNTVRFRTAGFLDTAHVNLAVIGSVVCHELGHWFDPTLREDHRRNYAAAAVFIVAGLMGAAALLLTITPFAHVDGAIWATPPTLAVCTYAQVGCVRRYHRSELYADAFAVDLSGIDATLQMLTTQKRSKGSYTHPSQARRIAHVQRYAAARGEG